MPRRLPLGRKIAVHRLDNRFAMNWTTIMAKVQLALWLLAQKLTGSWMPRALDPRSHAQDGGGWQDSWYGDLNGLDDAGPHGSPIPRRPVPGAGSASVVMSEPDD
jgi:hypothetical protein